MTMAWRLLLIATALPAVASCDMASEVAADTLESEMRGVVLAQCQEFAAGAGIAAGRVSAVCQCSADRFVADRQLSVSALSRDRLRTIVEGCVAQTDPDGVGR
jgi:predicted membrane-bound spermidine synthase